jgi:hypothetical protein
MLPSLKKNDKSKQSKKSTEESLYGDIYDKWQCLFISTCGHCDHKWTFERKVV